MSDQFLLAFSHALQGQHCIVEKREYDWALSFGDQCWVNVSVPWRIIQGGGIAFANSDDGQKFGLPEPIDGKALANALLEGKHVVYIEHDRLTADLHIYFDAETRIDVFNHSSGYEGWQAGFSFGEESGSIIGLGGGDMAIFSKPKP